MGKSTAKHIILMLGKDRSLTIKRFRNINKASENLFELEKKYPEKNIVLVRVEREEDLKIAFQSYFGNTAIIELNKKIDEALERMGGSVA